MGNLSKIRNSMNTVGNLLSNLQPGKIVQSSIRWASKKAGGSSKNRKGHAPGKRRGLKAQDEENVTINSILLRQLGIRCHPGLNVGIGKDGSLYALEPGTSHNVREIQSRHEELLGQ